VNKIVEAVSGGVTVNLAAAGAPSTAMQVFGLNFTAQAGGGQAGCSFSNVIATNANVTLSNLTATVALAIGYQHLPSFAVAAGTTVVTDLRGVSLLTPFGLNANVTVTTYVPYYFQGVDSNRIGTGIGLYMGDILNATVAAYAIECVQSGAPATPYLRVVCGAAPGAQACNAWADFGGIGLRQIKCGIAGSGPTAGHRALEILN